MRLNSVPIHQNCNNECRFHTLRQLCAKSWHSIRHISGTVLLQYFADVIGIYCGIRNTYWPENILPIIRRIICTVQNIEDARIAAVQIWERRDLCLIQFCTICCGKNRGIVDLTRAAVVTFRKCEIHEHLSDDEPICQRRVCLYRRNWFRFPVYGIFCCTNVCVFFLDAYYIYVRSYVRCKRKEEGHIRGQGETSLAAMHCTIQLYSIFCAKIE